GASSVVGPMYISEIAPAKIRGRLAGMFQLNIVAGILAAYLTNYLLAGYGGEDSWRYMLAAMAVPAIVFFILLFFIPESPRWLAVTGKIAEAQNVFRKLGQEEALQEVLDDHHKQNNGIKE